MHFFLVLFWDIYSWNKNASHHQQGMHTTKISRTCQPCCKLSFAAAAACGGIALGTFGNKVECSSQDTALLDRAAICIMRFGTQYYRG